MNEIYQKILTQIQPGEIKTSAHGPDELANDNILVKEVLSGVTNVTILEEYPDFQKGQCVLVLQKDTVGSPIHAGWGIPKNRETPAVLITAYRPDPSRWLENFTKRKK